MADSPAREIELPCEIAALDALAGFLEGFAAEQGIDPTTILHLNLALDELVTNAVIHGGCSSPLHLCVSRHGDVVRAELVDRGRRFDPFRDAPAPDLDAPLEERRIGGLGVHLVKKSMDLVDYEWKDGANRVRIERRIGRSPSPGARSDT